MHPHAPVRHPRPAGRLPPYPCNVIAHPRVTLLFSSVAACVSCHRCCIVCSVAASMAWLPAVSAERVRHQEISRLRFLGLRLRTGCLKVSWSGFKFKRQQQLGPSLGEQGPSGGCGLRPPLERLRGFTQVAPAWRSDCRLPASNTS